jgi:2-dehydro-3-deoxy-D-arabinonate dehydratase
VTAVKICRFLAGDAAVRIGLVDDDANVVDLTPARITTLAQVLESDDPLGLLNGIDRKTLPRFAVSDVIVRPPIERQEVWAAGVTYLRSKTARMEESDFSATAYDRVYDADRPEIFFKALAEKVVPTGEAVGIRRDATWSVPEPELALVINSRGQIAGCTIGNDMSSRDIEGENLLYLPQAKVYDRSCALGPWIRLGVAESEARDWTVRSTIIRAGERVFSGETRLGNIKRTFEELAGYLCRSQTFPHGAVLLTGTGIVPPDDFTLQEHDVVEIEIAPIGVLRNSVVIV